MPRIIYQMTDRANERFKGIADFDFGQVPDKQRERNGRYIRDFLFSVYGLNVSASVAPGHGHGVRVYVIDLKKDGFTKPKTKSAKGLFVPTNGSILLERDIAAEYESRRIDI